MARRLSIEVSEELYRSLSTFPYGGRRVIVTLLLQKLLVHTKSHGFDAVLAAALDGRLTMEMKNDGGPREF